MRKVMFLLLSIAFILPWTLRAQKEDQRGRSGDRDEHGRSLEHHDHNVKTPVHLVGVIPVPGNPVVSTDISWTDPVTERYYFADRSNFGVDIIDAEEDVFVGRVTGMAGPNPSGGGTTTTNGPGPNGVLVTPNQKLWAGDGNSMVRIADVNPDSPSYLTIIASASTSIPACDSSTAHYCGRADELGYDPRHHLILIANDAPRDVNPPHAPIAPYATFISAVPPYSVLGRVSFPNAGGLEQPLWDAELGRFLLTVPGKIVNGLVAQDPTVAVINPTTEMVEKAYDINCQTLTGTTSVSANGIALAPFQHVLVSACGFPIILSALNGHVFNVITQVGGGDEVWHNPGDGRFFVTGVDKTAPVQPGVQSLGVIDAETSEWLQNVADPGGRNPAAFAENNHIFTIVRPTAAMVANPATDNTTCAQFGFRGTGCVALFEHDEK
jgi:hypothetical protein